MSEMPEGTILGEGQSWNKNGYVQTEGKRCDRQALVTAFANSGVTETLPWLKEQAAKGVAVPPYATFRLWAAAKKLKTTPVPSNAPSPAAPASLADVEAAYKSGIQSLIDTLEKREQELSKELESVMSDLEKAREKLTKFD
ncbi:hypothetical protein BGP82_00385 [Pseudomonas putida]|uniref:Uncharacterized protein n=1 Tax=Pseudomonas putida TaxID=303 RepID=A0A2S3XBV1_PSEPU|nr:hypothetical protein [Pseudomonas putida]POG12957.1 hypothetical protein BGP82_00385 [Pseudomonas putida]